MTRWTHIIILTITIGMVVDPFTPAQNTSGQVGLTLVGQLVGDVTSIVVDGSLAYAVLTQGQGQELVVLDVSQPASPMLIGPSIPLPGPVHHMVLTSEHPVEVGTPENTQDFLYITAGTAFLIVNASSSNLMIISAYELPGMGEEIVVFEPPASGRVYVGIATGDSGVRFLDVTDPGYPFAAGYFDTPGYAWRLAVETTATTGRTFAYVTDRLSALIIVEITDPAHPVQMAIYRGFNDSLRGCAIAVANSYAFVGDRGRLYLLDVHNPVQPREIRFSSRVDMGIMVRMAWADGYLFILDQFGQLQMADVRDPLHPIPYWPYVFDTHGQPFALTASLPLPGREIPLAYVASGTQGVQIVGWADIRHAFRVGWFDLPGNAYGVAVETRAEGTYAYVGDRDGALHILDVTYPHQLKQVAAYDTEGSPWRIAVVDQRYAYVAAGARGLQIVDISDLAHPQAAGDLYVPQARGVAATANLACVADRYLGMLGLINVADPTNPVLLTQFYTGGGVFAVAVREGKVYVADGATGLKVVDISDPVHPAVVGVLPLPDVAVDIEIVRTLAFVAGRESGLHIVDVHDPAQPVLLSTFDTPGEVWGLSAQRERVFLADGPAGVRMVDVSDPAQPVEIAAYDTPGFAWDVAALGKLVYVADETGGLLILQRARLQSWYFPLAVR